MKPARMKTTRDVTTYAGEVFGWWGRSRTFLAQVRNEMERVTWPTWREVQATTVVVLLVSIAFGLYLWGIDLVLDRFARSVFQLFGA